MARHVVNDIIYTLASNKPGFALEPTLLPLLESSLSFLQENFDDKMYQLTLSEQFVASGWDRLLPIACWFSLGSGHMRSSKDVKKDMQSLAAWVRDGRFEKSPTDMLATSEKIQDMLLRLELLKAISTFCSTATTVAKTKGVDPKRVISSDLVSKLRSAAVEGAKVITSFASQWRDKERLSGKQMITELLRSDETAEDLTDVFGAEDWSPEGSIRDILESSVDALDGVTKVSVV